ncbi:MAG: hypothetical protein KIT19_08955 [Phycisphaeraceae bacterium]|nr:hypothetical protein [Phycisphaeraceae bacterium]
MWRIASFVALRVGLVGLIVWAVVALEPERKWVRKQPLANPIGVVSVEGGVLHLADGRSIRVAGIEPRAGVDAELFDTFLRAATVQGVEIERDAGDGSAVMLAEPRFHYTCGTCARGRLGHSISCRLDVLAIMTDHAEMRDSEALTGRERWRLEAAMLLRNGGEPVSIGVRGDSLAMCGATFNLARFDEYAEAIVGRGPE